MPTSVPYFSFLDPLVLEIWRGSQNKKWELLISKTPPSGQIFTWSYSTRKFLPAYEKPNFNFLPLLVTEIKRGSQNLMCAASTWQLQTAYQISAS